MVVAYGTCPQWKCIFSIIRNGYQNKKRKTSHKLSTDFMNSENQKIEFKTWHISTNSRRKGKFSAIKGCREKSNSVEALPNLTMLHWKAMPARFQVNHQHFRLNLCCFSYLAWIDANKLIEAKFLTSAMPPKSPIASSFSSATSCANKGMKTSCEIQ